MTRVRRGLALLAASALAASVLGACSSGGSDDDADGTTTTTVATNAPTTTGPLGSEPPAIVDGLRIEVLSSQPDRVSGDDARIRVRPGPDHEVSDLKVFLDDRDVTAQLEATSEGLEGVVTGLIEGNNELVAKAGTEEVLQRIRAWPLTGPVFSGPQLPVFGCTTEALGLGAPTDDDCTGLRRTTWRYVTKAGTVVDLPEGGAVPADIATAEVDGRSHPLFVRVERGTVDRAVYELATIAASPDEAVVEDGWARKLVVRLSGECGTTFGQGTGLVPPDPDLLRQGYATLSTTASDAGATCNDVLGAEALAMAKERTIELLGVPQFTIGVGEQGGGTLAHLIVQSYPGVLNGIAAIDALPDTLSTLGGVADCAALQRYFSTPTGSKLTAAQRLAISGQPALQACDRWASDLFGLVVPTDGCDPAMPADRRYDPRQRPNGIRCTIFDTHRNQLGTTPDDDVWRTLDNEGLQYGFEALNDGTITFDQFIELNQAIGGWGPDGQLTKDRTIAPLDGIARAYETGRISMAGGDQLVVPTIDIDRYDDETGSPYDLRRPFSLRDRLTRGQPADAAPNFQIWVRDADDPRTADVDLEAIAVLDEWLSGLVENQGGGSMTEVLRRTRPAEAVDQCQATDDAAPRQGPLVFDPDEGECADDFPIGGDPRTAAGGPRSGHVLKCERKAPDPADYTARLTDEQFQELQQTFPTGVCDWFIPSSGQTTPAAPDRSYEDVYSPEQDL